MAGKLRVLVVHNAYQQKGGEDSVVESEMAMLRSQGNQVAFYSRHNDDIPRMRPLALVAQTLWSSRSETEIKRFIADFRPEVIHVHNTFPLISPSLYWAANAAGVPVVQTLHNFRFFCQQAMFQRDKNICEDCLGKLPWRGVVRGCYRDSVAQSAVLGGMLALHRGLGTYRHKVTRYIALNEFCRTKFIEGGLSGKRIVVKPNFVDYPAPPVQERSGFLFVGRLSAEKGIATLAQAAGLVPNVMLRVAGSGPEQHLLKGITNVRLIGSVANREISHEMHAASALLMPSIWYENFPRTLVEAFASGLPVIASRMGAMAELVEEGKTGLLFTPGSATDLATKMAWAEANPEAMRQMGKRARLEYEAKYTPERNYEQLMAIYGAAISEMNASK